MIATLLTFTWISVHVTPAKSQTTG